MILSVLIMFYSKTKIVEQSILQLSYLERYLHMKQLSVP